MTSSKSLAVMALVGASALVLTACTGSAKPIQSLTTSPSTPSSSVTTPSAPPPSTSSAPAGPASIAFTPVARAENVSPKAPVSVTVKEATLTAVTMVNGAGGVVEGRLAADRTTWTPSVVLGYDKTYTLTANAVDARGKRLTKTSTFSTLNPDNLTQPYLNTASGYALSAGTYGAGQSIAVHFDESITDKAAAERALKVTSVPAQEGAWNWIDAQTVKYRPRVYWKAGTKVTVAAMVYGVEVGPGLYGQSDQTMSFKIGKAQISKVNDANKIIRVYQDGKLVRSMKTSMGKGGSSDIKGVHISYTTNSGPHTVLETAPETLMDSETFGLPHAQGGYKQIVKDTVKISIDGEYVHAAPWSVWAQGTRNTSHGCLNVSPADAAWFRAFSQVGDIVDVEGTSQKLQSWNSGEWTVPWATWKAGSALN